MTAITSFIHLYMHSCRRNSTEIPRYNKVGEGAGDGRFVLGAIHAVYGADVQMHPL